MPKPFHQINVAQFAELLAKFPFERRIDSVHMHHTWRPNHAQYRGLSTINGMWEFHTKTQKWSDIAQHISIAPDGAIWTGRNWNEPPASAAGFNGNRNVGPFMFEIIGDFDRGKDLLEGAQRQAVLEVIAHLQKRFSLEPQTLRFHNAMSEKTCPGSSVDLDTILGEVARVRAQIDKEAPAVERAADFPFEDRMRPVWRIIADLSAPVPASRGGDEGEGCDHSSGQAREFERTTADAPASGRASRDGGLPPDVIRRLRPHVINLNTGRLSATGQFQTSEADVDAIFEEHLVDWSRGRDPREKLPIVFYAHGGLTSEEGGLTIANQQIDWWKENGAYPIHFVWETGLMETLTQILNPRRQRAIDVFAPTDRALEAVAHKFGGVKIWNGMKVSAERGVDKEGGARYAARKLKEFCDREEFKSRVELHAIGHSAGSIFHAHFIPTAFEEGTPPFDSLQFLAPAIRVDAFERLLLPHIATDKGVKRLTVFTMARDFERADHCAVIYRKSLLYLIHYALEPERSTPILGLEESIRENPRLKRLFSLDRAGDSVGEVIWSETKESILPPHASRSRSHGGFDQERLTMESVGQRILGRRTTPFIVKDETRARGVLETLQDSEPALRQLFEGSNAEPATFRGTFPGVTTGNSRGGARSGGGDGRGGGRKLALCVGIDRYSVSPLGGCVNDAQQWRRTFRSLGFEEPRVLLDEEATRSAIIGELTALLGSARAGDVIAFQFAGHGTQLPDLDGDEAGGDTPGRDEALCPVDFDQGRYVIDDDLAAVFDKIPAGVNVTVFADCCHSGSNTRLAIGPPPLAASGRNVRKRYLVATEQMKEAHKAFRNAIGATRGARGRGAYDQAREVLFAACRSSEVALESDGQGHFTTRALRLLGSGVDGITNAEFQERVRGAFGSNAGQNPELHCADALRSRLLLQPITERTGDDRQEPMHGATSAAGNGAWRAEVARVLEGAARTIRCES